MTLEEMLMAVNKNLDEFRASGDIKAFNATKVMKTEILKEMGAEVAKEYVELFGKQLIFLLTISSDYVTIKTMERDFWSGNHPLGHMPLLVSPEKDDDMTTLAAKGYTTDGVPVYLWAYGGYEYAVEVKKDTFTETECLDCTFEEAMDKFNERAVNGVEILGWTMNAKSIALIEA